MADISELLAKQAEMDLTVPGGKTVHVKYRPGVITPESLEAMAQAAATGSGSEAFMAQFAELVVDWDVTADGKKVDPSKPDHLKKVPMAFLGHVMTEAQKRQAVPE